MHLLASLEGFGFCKEGEAGAFVQGVRIEIVRAAAIKEAAEQPA